MLQRGVAPSHLPRWYSSIASVTAVAATVVLSSNGVAVATIVAFAVHIAVGAAITSDHVGAAKAQVFPARPKAVAPVDMRTSRCDGIGTSMDWTVRRGLRSFGVGGLWTRPARVATKCGRTALH